MFLLFLFLLLLFFFLQIKRPPKGGPRACRRSCAPPKEVAGRSTGRTSHQRAAGRVLAARALGGRGPGAGRASPRWPRACPLAARALKGRGPPKFIYLFIFWIKQKKIINALFKKYMHKKKLSPFKKIAQFND